ncbi:MAG TPA: hypothetical protein PK986_11515, partial [Spirochaetota bacterium]|nr:hypothetical protein [Spirochaetota bacterium]
GQRALARGPSGDGRGRAGIERRDGGDGDGEDGAGWRRRHGRGARSADQVRDNLGGASLVLSGDEIAVLVKVSTDIYTKIREE